MAWSGGDSARRDCGWQSGQRSRASAHADTERRRRIELQPTRVDELAAILALTIAAIVATAQRGLDAPQRLLSALARTLRHRLLLHRVHARQPADAGLIQHHGRRGGIALLRQAQQIRARRQELGAEVIDIGFGCLSHLSSSQSQALCQQWRSIGYRPVLPRGQTL